MKRLLSFFLAIGLSCSLALPAAALEAEDAKQLLEAYYIDTLPDGFSEMTSLEEIISAIDDPYTTYLSAEEYQLLLNSVNGESVVGIGISIQTAYDNGYQILSILPDSPAVDSELRVGDYIVAVDATPLTPNTDPSTLIRGEEGTPVTLTIRQKDSGLLYNVTLTRKKVAIPIVTHEKLEDALVISCDSFGESTVDAFQEALSQFGSESAACIVDLRSNPGGTSTAAAGAAGTFLGSAVISYFRDADESYSYISTRSYDPDQYEKPLIVLTSPYSASASEMFTAAIRDYARGISIGQRTFGKGVAQYVFDETTHPDLFDGDCLKITIYRFFSPDGITNDTIGILPTLAISEENCETAALLLSAPEPQWTLGYLKLKIAGQVFFLHLSTALTDENRPAFQELLEALPTNAELFRGIGGTWNPVSAAKLADNLKLTYTPRTFSDISNSPYQDEIHTLAGLQLLSGFGDGTFQPQSNITRGQFCSMISTALSLSPAPELAQQRFADITSSLWMAGAAGAMADMGFIRGFEDGTFRPDAPITYQEVVTILNHIAGWATMDGYENNKKPLSVQNAHIYLNFAPWAQVAARNLYLLDALLPDTDPTHIVTREEAAASLCRLMDGCGLLWR